MKKLKLILLILFILSLFCTLDLGFNLLYNLIPEHLDGYTTRIINIGWPILIFLSRPSLYQVYLTAI